MMDIKRFKRGKLPNGMKEIVIFKKKKYLKMSLSLENVIKDILIFYENNNVPIVGFNLYNSSAGDEQIVIAYNPTEVDKDVMVEANNDLIKQLFDEKKVDWDFCVSIEMLLQCSFYLLPSKKKGFTIKYDEDDTDDFINYFEEHTPIDEDLQDEMIDTLADMEENKWFCSNPKHNSFVRRPSDIDKYVESLSYQGATEDQNKFMRTCLKHYLRFIEFQALETKTKKEKVKSAEQDHKITKQVEEPVQEKVMEPVKEHAQEPVESVTDHVPATIRKADHEEKKDRKYIRVDINIEDLDDFMEFLETREPNRQVRERYRDSLQTMYRNDWNQRPKTTFVDDKSYRVDPEQVEIFVNGIESGIFKVNVKQFQHSVELYLDYKSKKKYEPQRFKKKELPAAQRMMSKPKEHQEEMMPDGDFKIFGTVVNLDGFYSWMKNGKQYKPKADDYVEKVKHIQQLAKKHRNVFEKFAKVEDTESAVHILVDIPEISDGTKDELDNFAEALKAYKDYDDNKNEESTISESTIRNTENIVSKQPYTRVKNSKKSFAKLMVGWVRNLILKILRKK
jgi:hypothetical protein